MTFRVIDTNVAIVANSKAPQANASCILSCITMLESIINSGGVVIDAGLLILTEYMHNLSLSGQPGPGDAFMKWVWQHQADDSCCICVRITEDATRGFVEFPNVPALQAFDRSDRKFVAVALTCPNKTEILNAVDSDWWDHRQALSACGVHLRFLCRDQFAERE